MKEFPIEQLSPELRLPIPGVVLDVDRLVRPLSDFMTGRFDDSFAAGSTYLDPLFFLCDITDRLGVSVLRPSLDRIRRVLPPDQHTIMDKARSILNAAYVPSNQQLLEDRRLIFNYVSMKQQQFVDSLKKLYGDDQYPLITEEVAQTISDLRKSFRVQKGTAELVQLANHIRNVRGIAAGVIDWIAGGILSRIFNLLNPQTQPTIDEMELIDRINPDDLTYKELPWLLELKTTGNISLLEPPLPAMDVELDEDNVGLVEVDDDDNALNW